MILAFLRAFISIVHVSSLCFSVFPWFRRVMPSLTLKIFFFFSFLASLSKMTNQRLQRIF